MQPIPWTLKTRLVSSFSYSLVHYFSVHMGKFYNLISVLWYGDLALFYGMNAWGIQVSLSRTQKSGDAETVSVSVIFYIIFT